MACSAWCLLKLIVPVPLTGSGWQPIGRARQATERVSAWALAGRSPPAAASRGGTACALGLPATGDVGASLAEVSSLQPVGTRSSRAGLARRQGRSADGPSGGGATARAGRAFVPGGFDAGLGRLRRLPLGAVPRSMVRTRRLIRQAIPLPLGAAADRSRLAAPRGGASHGRSLGGRTTGSTRPQSGACCGRP